MDESPNIPVLSPTKVNTSSPLPVTTIQSVSASEPPALAPTTSSSSASEADKCDNPECTQLALIICAICNEAPLKLSNTPATQHCATECQRVDITQHKAVCDKMQDRTMLYRVMDVALKQFLVYREMTWHAFEVTSLRRMGGKQVEGNGEEFVVVCGEKIRNAVWPDDYRPFPNEKIKYKEDKEALLVFLSKLDAVAWSLEWIHGLLGGVYTTIESVVHGVANPPRKMMLKEEIVEHFSVPSPGRANGSANSSPVRGSRLIWEEFNCEVLKITLRSGEIFAIDLAAAQYGHFDQPVVEWNEYEKARITSTTILAPQLATCALHPHDFRLSTITKAYHRYLDDDSQKDLLIRQLESLNVHIMEWQHEGGMGMRKLWELPEMEYKEKAENLNEFLEWKLHRFYKVNTTTRGRELARIMRLQGKWNFGGSILGGKRL